MSNVIDLFTGKTLVLNIEPSLLDKYADTYLEPVARLAMRFDKSDINDVLLKPAIKTSSDTLTIKTYKGNNHTGKIDHGRAGLHLPLPVDIYEYSRVLHKYTNIILEDECFMYMDRRYKLTYQLLNDINECIPKNLKTITIRTRSDVFAHDQYLDILESIQAQGVNIGFKLYGMGISERENKARWPGAPSVKRRVKALDKATSRLKLRLKAL